jgi:cohesin loading factor subunit SCC2
MTEDGSILRGEVVLPEEPSTGYLQLCRLLLTCAQVVAALPFRKADEPLATVVHVNSIIAKRGDAVLSAFKAALQHTAAPGAAAAANTGNAGAAAASSPAAGGPAAVQLDSDAAACIILADLANACNASLAVSMLLLLKSYLLAAYGLASERVALFATGSAERRKQVGLVTSP